MSFPVSDGSIGCVNADITSPGLVRAGGPRQRGFFFLVWAKVGR